MTKWYLGAALVGLLLATPLIVLNVWGIRVSLRMGADEQFQADLAAGKTTADQALDFPTSPLEWLGDRAEVKGAFNLTGMNKERVVSFDIELKIEDMLAEGEEIPEEELIPLYAEARAPGYLMQFCPDILKSVGSKCIAIFSETNVADDGTIHLYGQLAYLPNYDLGLPENHSGNALLSARGTTVSPGNLMPEFKADDRVQFLNQAAANCDLLRAQYGNCIISRVYFRSYEWSQFAVESAPHTTAPLRLLPTAEYSVFATDTPESLEKLRATVAAF